MSIDILKDTSWGAWLKGFLIDQVRMKPFMGWGVRYVGGRIGSV